MHVDDTSTLLDHVGAFLAQLSDFGNAMAKDPKKYSKYRNIIDGPGIFKFLGKLRDICRYGIENV